MNNDSSHVKMLKIQYIKMYRWNIDISQKALRWQWLISKAMNPKHEISDWLR